MVVVGVGPSICWLLLALIVAMFDSPVLFDTLDSPLGEISVNTMALPQYQVINARHPQCLRWLYAYV
jgi:hypothetical protein